MGIVDVVQVLPAVLIAAVSNLDNLAAGFAFGSTAKRIAAVPNAIIAAITMVATGGALTLGHALPRLTTQSTATLLGGLMLIAIGAWTVAASVATLRTSVSGPGAAAEGRLRLASGPLAGHVAGNGVISHREAVALGIALSLNNVAAGLGAGAAGITPLTTTLLAGGFSLACVGGGSRIGWAIARHLTGRYAPTLGGAILVALGIASLAGAG
jgi:putative sporulation protein YtaF